MKLTPEARSRLDWIAMQSGTLRVSTDDVQAALNDLDDLTKTLESFRSEDPLGRLVGMVLDLLKQRSEFERLAKAALDQRDKALLEKKS